VLRAWRLEFDPHRTGQCSRADFAQTCRRLGLLGSEGQLFWASLRPDGSSAALKFHDLDPDEAQNLELVEQVLWDSCGFDLDRAWAEIDPGNRTSVTLPEFKAGMRKLGFTGNAKILFLGLDTTGIGRLTRRDFEYLRRLSPTLLQMSNSHPLVLQFHDWVQQEFDDPRLLLARLGLSDRGFGGEEPPSLSVMEFAKRLPGLGFTGDSHAVAVLASKLGSGTNINAEKLGAVLSGRRGRSPAPGDRGVRPHESPASGFRTPRPMSPRSMRPASPRGGAAGGGGGAASPRGNNGGGGGGAPMLGGSGGAASSRGGAPILGGGGGPASPRGSIGTPGRPQQQPMQHPQLSPQQLQKFRSFEFDGSAPEFTGNNSDRFGTSTQQPQLPHQVSPRQLQPHPQQPQGQSQQRPAWRSAHNVSPRKGPAPQPCCGGGGGQSGGSGQGAPRQNGSTPWILSPFLEGTESPRSPPAKPGQRVRPGELPVEAQRAAEKLKHLQAELASGGDTKESGVMSWSRVLKAQEQAWETSQKTIAASLT